MTEKMKTFLNLNIPVGVFAIIVTVMIAFIGFTVNANAKGTRNETLLEIHDKLIDGKVNRETYDADIHYLVQQLNDIKSSQARIEKKLSEHVENAE